MPEEVRKGIGALADILRNSEMEPVALLSATVQVYWGLWIAFPWAAGCEPAVPAPLEAIAPRWAWGALYFSVGLLTLRSLSRRDWRCRKRWYFISSLSWILAGAAAAVSSWSQPLYIASFAAAAMLMWGYIRLGGATGDGVGRGTDD